MPFVLNVPSVENVRVEGRCQTADPNPFAIPLPQLPYHGAWSVHGTVLAFNAGATGPAINNSIAFLVTIAGNSVAGVALRTDGLSPPYTAFPATGGLAVAISGSIGNRVLILTLEGGEAGTILWGWDIELEFLSKPF